MSRAGRCLGTCKRPKVAAGAGYCCPHCGGSIEGVGPPPLPAPLVVAVLADGVSDRRQREALGDHAERLVQAEIQRAATGEPSS